MKIFQEHYPKKDAVKAELKNFNNILQSKKDLSESKDILPFFKSSLDLSTFIGTIAGECGIPNRVAHEFDLFGDFKCDLAVGDSNRKAFCFVEFEDATANSIFTKSSTKSTQEWSRRFEHGFSQLVDWLWQIEDNRQTRKFREVFGSDEIYSVAMLIIGRDLYVPSLDRLRWRSSHCAVGNTKVYAYTYDQLYEIIKEKLHFFAP